VGGEKTFLVFVSPFFCRFSQNNIKRKYPLPLIFLSLNFLFFFIFWLLLWGQKRAPANPPSQTFFLGDRRAPFQFFVPPPFYFFKSEPFPFLYPTLNIFWGPFILTICPAVVTHMDFSFFFLLAQKSPNKNKKGRHLTNPKYT